MFSQSALSLPPVNMCDNEYSISLSICLTNSWRLCHMRLVCYHTGMDSVLADFTFSFGDFLASCVGPSWLTGV